MRTLRLIVALVGAPVLVLLPGAAQATVENVPLVVASGLRQPDDVAVAPGEPRRLYIVEQRGTIRVAVRGRVLRRPFLDIRPLVKKSLLQGLFAVAFHPSYATNGRFYVDYVDRQGQVKVVEYRTRSGKVVPSSARTVLELAVGTDHYGGDLVFGPDGKLYVGVGDGSVGSDAQKADSPRGKILRLDVDKPDAVPELVAMGLRNPWRFSFDRRTGDLFIGDVGANAWEEIDLLPHSVSTVLNYGWNLYEGRQRTSAAAVTPPPNLTFPLSVYRHPRKACAAVVGGYVYRGSSRPAMRGRYVYGDLCSTTIWSIRVVDGRAVGRRREPFVVPGGITSFGEGAGGELYAVSQNGSVYRLG